MIALFFLFQTLGPQTMTEKDRQDENIQTKKACNDTVQRYKSILVN